jgi:hypothetical protein
MNSSYVLPMAVGSSILVGCAGYEVHPQKDSKFNYMVDVHLGLMSFPFLNDLTLGTNTAFRVARKTCGAASNVTAEELKLMPGYVFVNSRGFEFTCPNSVEEVQ